ncbi:MAG: response regulator [Prevotella sp.]
MICLIASLHILFACNDNAAKTYSDEEKAKTDSVVIANRNIDSLTVLAERFKKGGDGYGEIAAYRELGKCLREDSRFEDAINAHKKGLECAVKACDTLQIIQALNNIGTNFRRMGILDEASSYHYQALTLYEAYSDKESKAARKSRVISLNGIGNVHLTLDNREAADSVFRMALAGEQELGSALGQAINCANIGSIFESNGQADSAWHYYRLSMKFNREEKSDLGISLCHTHFGRLYEKENKLDSAVNEYSQAYRLMQDNSDTWHWLESCLALARVYIEKGNLTAAAEYLDKAKATAKEINSLEHLAEAYRLEYMWNRQRGDYRAALESFIKSDEYADSVSNDKNVKHIQNVRVKYERERKDNEINLIQTNYENEKLIRQTSLVIFVILLVLACVIIAFMWFAIRMRSQKQEIMRQTEKMRTNFFTNITHEFRTPLTIIQAAAQEIRNMSETDSDIHRNATNIIRQEKGLLLLINQILDITKMTSVGVQATAWKHGDIVEFIKILCESYKSYASNKGIELVYAPQQERLEIDFIPDYMQKTIQNLISNAIKFSGTGSSILVTTRTKGRAVQIYVSDTGIGMTAEQKENIFKPFYQADNNTNIGTGIGLSLVKLAVENMRGKIEVHSAPDEGTVFIITLPITRDTEVEDVSDITEQVVVDATELPIEDNDVPTEDSYDDEEDNDTVRILIIEDTADVAYYMKRQLNPDYNYYFAADGNEGLQKAELLVPDLIITDIMMPGMDGFELCKEVRHSELLNHIPVIMVTAKATHEDRLHGLEVGADAYLEKPFHADELYVRVEKLMEQRRLLRRKYSSEIEDISEPETTPTTDFNKIFLDKLTGAIHEELEKGKMDYDALAYNMCLSRAQLNRKVKAITGYTTTNLILQVRISLAKHLLDTTEDSIGDIAMKCGMDNNSYFSSLFKKSTGMTPMQYKNRKR